MWTASPPLPPTPPNFVSQLHFFVPPPLPSLPLETGGKRWMSAPLPMQMWIEGRKGQAWAALPAALLYRIHALEHGVSKMHIFNMSQLHHTLSKAYGNQSPCFIPLKNLFMWTFRRLKDFKIGRSTAEITHRSKFWGSVVHPVYTTTAN